MSGVVEVAFWISRPVSDTQTHNDFFKAFKCQVPAVGDYLTFVSATEDKYDRFVVEEVSRRYKPVKLRWGRSAVEESAAVVMVATGRWVP